uniref:Uncharacterized protein n=1 Tax=Amphimedon queenslandica TaxID=400682 RepID=A0A1X7V3K5_AMPQE
MSVSSEDVTRLQLFDDMMSKFENEESPPFVGYDPSHPTIFLTLFKWYDDPEKAAEQLIELYPHDLP